MGWLFFSPSGRIGRHPFLLAVLFWMVVPAIPITQMFAHQHEDAALALWTLGLLVTFVASVVSLVMLTIKRVHDMGFPGLFAFLLFVPVISFIALLAFMVWPADGPNIYGQQPNRPK